MFGSYFSPRILKLPFENNSSILSILVYALFNSYQLGINEIERSRVEKLYKRGGFDDRIILEKVIEK